MSTTVSNPTPRIAAVDCMRFFAIIAVIIIHTIPFRNIELEHQGQYDILGVVLNILARFGVPFFFTVSGYFWGLKIRSGQPVMPVSAGTAKRLLLILVVWCLVYLLPYNLGAIFEHGMLGPIKVWYWHLRELASDPLLIFFEGTHQHLWFLIALLWAVAISAVFVRLGLIKLLASIGIALYVFGVLSLAYAHTPIGIVIPFYSLEGPFFGTIFFVTGYVLSGYTPHARWLKFGIALMLIGYALHFTEAYLLWKWWQIRPIYHYVFGTYFIGLGVTMIVLCNPSWLRSEALAKIGRVTLGIYAGHYIFVEWLEPINAVVSHPVWEIGRVLLVLGLSAGVALWLSKFKTLKKFVT